MNCYIYIYIFIIKTEIGLIYKILENDTISKLISIKKRFKTYIKDNLNISKILKILSLMKHIDEHKFDVTSLFNQSNVVV